MFYLIKILLMHSSFNLLTISMETCFQKMERKKEQSTKRTILNRFETFRRIVRYQVKRQQKLLLSEELRQILRDQITGIEINEEAIRVAAFSLYLALLHYQEPRDILENKRLPNLIYIKDKEKDEQYYNLLFNANAFGLTPEEKNELEGDIRQKKIFKGRANLQLLLNAEQNLDVKLHSFDVVVGNPPWSEVSKYINPLPCDDLPLLYEVPKPFRYDKQSHTLLLRIK